MSKWVAIFCCSCLVAYAQDAEVASFEMDDMSMEMVVEMDAPAVDVAVEATVEVAVEAPSAE